VKPISRVQIFDFVGRAVPIFENASQDIVDICLAKQTADSSGIKSRSSSGIKTCQERPLFKLRYLLGRRWSNPRYSGRCGAAWRSIHNSASWDRTNYISFFMTCPTLDILKYARERVCFNKWGCAGRLILVILLNCIIQLGVKWLSGTVTGCDKQKIKEKDEKKFILRSKPPLSITGSFMETIIRKGEKLTPPNG
jgi:hypothetical protein